MADLGAQWQLLYEKGSPGPNSSLWCQSFAQHPLRLFRCHELDLYIFTNFVKAPSYTGRPFWLLTLSQDPVQFDA